MLKEIHFQNYKAFEKGTIKIKPITILLGANSIGKTSLLQLFLMLQQTGLASVNYKSALKLHGGFLSLGEGKNIFRKQDTSKKFIFKIDFTEENLIAALKGSLIYRRYDELLEYAGLSQNIIFKQSKNQKDFHQVQSIFQKVKYNSRREFKVEDKLLVEIEKLINLIIEGQGQLKKMQKDNVLFEDVFYFRNPRFIKNIEQKRDQILDSFGFLINLSKSIKDDSLFSVEYEIVLKDNTLLISNFKLSIDGKILFDVNTGVSKDNTKFSFSIPFIDGKKIPSKFLETIKKQFVQPRTIFSFLKPDEDFNDNVKEEIPILTEIVAEIISESLGYLENYFGEENINYVSPLRAHPKRYYFLDKAKINTYLDTLDGDALAEILKENSSIKKQVNDWLKKFNLNIEVTNPQDILHKLTINQNQLQLDITDVGFGISQVLPVIIQGFLSFDDSITVIEQPEIHLHPKMQADLADLFISIVSKKKGRNNRSKNLIIETHSEYLLKRLRRRISEGAIKASDVAIYVVKKNEDISLDNSILEELNIGDKGNFKYPEEFYGGDLLDDDIVFLQNQANN
ncbi:MAG: AAA family ATPase [Bacteroidetes bacterium]|nr:AAA family ATPase [Bacteroidota bacterium]